MPQRIASLPPADVRIAVPRIDWLGGRRLSDYLICIRIQANWAASNLRRMAGFAATELDDRDDHESDGDERNNADEVVAGTEQ